MKIFLLATLLLPSPASAHKSQVPDLPPDATATQYIQHLSSQPKLLVEDDGLEPVVLDGQRSLRWLQHLNSFRPEGQKISLTSKSTQNGITIEKPSEYSPSIILASQAEIRAAYPLALAEVVFGTGAFPDALPVSEEVYIEWSRKLNRNYESALRWRTMSNWLPYLEERRQQDIRGYYFLLQLANREEKLAALSSLPEPERGQVRGWLVGLCFNDPMSRLEECQSRVDSAIGRGVDLNPLYEEWLATGKHTFESFFAIPNGAARADFRWESLQDGSSRLVAPFTDPGTPEVRHFMQFNVEDEWKWAGWALQLPFRTEPGHPYVRFVSGATPNVNRLGGDRITMNADQPLTEYDAQWTIRHEFGHVLGLPDCYVEFFEADRNVIVNYQIDVDNIMCSRRGHVKQVNVDELQRAYSR